ncbi:hypothetical protein V1525DRAFT_389767 [Lipomyces kononenkoae]|uniref:Uncharacterized protein n=1 Tax=Lipomyces kononenkoae TaxID=34357 RepID=A0ACC3SX01_LIPKO
MPDNTLPRFEMNDDRTVFFRAQHDPSKNVICPVKLLLVQALRTGNIKDSSPLGDALLNPSRRADKNIQLSFPDRPVIPAISRHNRVFLELDKPAACAQLRLSTIQLGLVAGVLAKLKTHDWRRGSARDVAHLKTEIAGVADHATAAALGHSRIATAKGITDKYVGSVGHDIYTDRVETGFDHRCSPALGAPFKKFTLRADETTKFCLDNNLNPTLKNHRRRAQDRIQDMRRSEWIEEQKNREAPPETLDDHPQNSTKHLAHRTQSQVDATSVASSVQTSRGKDSDEGSLKASGDETWNSFIDPQLLLAYGENSTTSLEDAECIKSSEADAGVDDGSANMVMSTLSGALEAAVGEDEAVDRELIGLLIENAQSELESPKLLLLRGDEFVVAFSRINIVRNINIRENSKNAFHHSETRAPSGNTRDPPTLFRYKCNNHTNGCTFTSKTKAGLALHLPICNPEKVEKPRPFKCERSRELSE